MLAQHWNSNSNCKKHSWNSNLGPADVEPTLNQRQLPNQLHFYIIGWDADIGSMLAQGWNSNSDVANHCQHWANLSLLSGLFSSSCGGKCLVMCVTFFPFTILFLHVLHTYRTCTSKYTVIDMKYMNLPLLVFCARVPCHRHPAEWFVCCVGDPR